MKQIIAQGAEATIYKNKNIVIKDRIPKKYRHPELDKKLRKRRTKSEFKLLTKASKLIPTPKPNGNISESIIQMTYIKGKKLSEHLEKLDYKKIAKLIGKNIAILHNEGIIHGDLTTSNMIYKEPRNESQQRTFKKDGKLFFIDFGLGFHSQRIEDKAVDLHLIHEALEARHPGIYKETYKSIINSYKKTSKNFKEVLKRLEKVEKRGRYKGQY